MATHLLPHPLFVYWTLKLIPAQFTDVEMRFYTTAMNGNLNWVRGQDCISSAVFCSSPSICYTSCMFPEGDDVVLQMLSLIFSLK